MIYPELFSTVLNSHSFRVLSASPIAGEPNSHELPMQVLFPQGCTHTNVPEGDLFISQALKLIQTDAETPVFLIPPWEGIGKGRERSATSIDLLIEKIAEAKVGIVGLLVPELFLTASTLAKSRRLLVEHLALHWIIEHDNQSRTFPHIHTAFKFATLIFSSDKRGPVRFFSVPSGTGYEVATVLEDLAKLQKHTGGCTKYGYVYREPIEPGAPLNYALRAPETVRTIDDLSVFGDTVTLERYLEAFVGINEALHQGNINREASNRLDSETLLIGGRNITRGGDLVDTGVSILAEGVTTKRLEPGDLCVRALWGPNDPILFAEVQGSPFAGAIPSQSIFVLRFRQEVSAEDRFFVTSYLRSAKASQILRSRTPGMRINAKALLDLPVPSPDRFTQSAVSQLLDAKSQIQRWAEMCDLELSQLFEYRDAQDKRRALLRSGTHIRRVTEAGRHASELDYIVRTQFPHPIAHEWRKVKAAGPNLEGYLIALQCAESLFCYLAALSYLNHRSVGVAISKFAEIGERLSNGKGTTIGDWTSIIKESARFSKRSDPVPFAEICELFEDPATDKCVKNLLQMRNNQSHGRGPRGDAQAAAEFEKTLHELTTLYTKCQFLADSRLIYVENTKIDILARRLTYTCRDLSGDQPYSPIRSDTSERQDIEAQSLYCIDRHGELHLLRPFLTRRECPECGHWTTFFLDQYRNKSKECVLRSMEHGHTNSDGSITNAFNAVGITLCK